ncbi:MAG: hypothetical protein IT165_25550 [Bryobacterales bacterium]|nr:hypothetical protein [Bryobacterales bacterium]
MSKATVILAALIGGFLGGLLSGPLARRNGEEPRPVVRARSFELVDKDGRVISFWGVDGGENVVLAFGSRGLAQGGTRGHSPLGLSNPENQLTAIGLLGEDSPMLKMRGTDGKPRVRLLLNTDGKPVLTMEEDGLGLSLGVEQSDTPGPEDNNWSLVFSRERARIGMGVARMGRQRMVRGVLFVNPTAVRYPD